MLCRLTVSPAHLPPLQSPTRPGSQCFRQMASCLKPLGWCLVANSSAHPPSRAQSIRVEPWDSTYLLSEYGCYADPLSPLQGIRQGITMAVLSVGTARFLTMRHCPPPLLNVCSAGNGRPFCQAPSTWAARSLGTQLGMICCLVTNPFLAPPSQAPAPTCPASGEASGCSAQDCFLRKESCLVNLGQGILEVGPAALGECAEPRRAKLSKTEPCHPPQRPHNSMLVVINRPIPEPVLKVSCW